MFKMAVPLKETEASLERLVDVSKGRLRAGLSMNRFSPMSQTWSPLHWVAGTAFSVDSLDEELLSFRRPPPPSPLCFLLPLCCFKSLCFHIHLIH